MISTIGRRSPKVRALIAFIYLALAVGAVTMIYPFWLMIVGTTKSGVDSADSDLIPRYLVDDTALYRKTLEGLFNEKLPDLRVAYNSPVVEFRAAPVPENPRDRFVGEWRRYQDEVKPAFYSYTLGHSQIQTSRGTFPYHLRAFKNTLYQLYDGGLERMNANAGTEFAAWTTFRLDEAACIYRRAMPNDRLNFWREWYAYKELSPVEMRAFPTATGYFKFSFLLAQYSDRIESYNESHGTDYADYDAVRLGERLPAEGTEAERRDWEYFVRHVLNLLWIRVDASATHAYRDFLRARHGGIDALNRAYGTAYADFDGVPLVERVPFGGPVFSDWGAFVQGWTDPVGGLTHQAPTESLAVRSVEFEFRDWLRERFKTVGEFNAACGEDFASFDDILPPQREFHWRGIMNEKGRWRREYTIRNYIAVADYIFLQGRALTNTAIYCVLAVLCALIVNPLAAYALSRFRPPSTFKILLFLMLTMAFPPTVTQIPTFLMLREAGLLNTFAALILPGLANGYQIFLLKGFFDSLPREIYESAQLDGAGEVRMFWQFTMSLSTPILAVIALGAFTGAYANFMMALLICQDKAMWTLMPWLYQLQMTSSEGIVYASLILASLPTFIVFVFAQNVIMRGIVVPVEK